MMLSLPFAPRFTSMLGMTLLLMLSVSGRSPAQSAVPGTEPAFIPLFVQATAGAPGGIEIDGYNWQLQWVTAKSTGNCTKNQVPAYEAVIEARNIGSTTQRVRSLVFSSGADGQHGRDGYFAFDHSNRATSIQPGDEIMPGETKRQKVLFMPKDVQNYQGRVWLTTEANDTIAAMLIGAGIESRGEIYDIRFDTTEYTGDYPGTPLQVKRATIYAFPTRPLTVIGIEITGPDADMFVLGDVPALPFTLQPGKRAEFLVEFRTRGAGLKTAEIRFTGDHSLCDDSIGVLRGYVIPSSGVEREEGRGGQLFATSTPQGAEIRFSLEASREVHLEIFNPLGKRVALLLEEELEAGEHAVRWNDPGQPAGIYYCRMVAGDWERTIPLMVR